MKPIFSDERTHPQAAATKILLVDDDPRMLDSLSRLLGHYGYETELAATGAEALGKLDTGLFDLTLLDIGMPDISGFRLMEHILDKKLSTAIIVVSGDGSPDTIARALQMGAHDYIKKPYSPEELIATVNNAARKKELERVYGVMKENLDFAGKLHGFIVEHSPDIIFTLDEFGNFSFINSQIERLLGYDKCELMGKSFYALIRTGDAGRIQQYLQDMPHSRSSSFSTEIALNALSGKPAERYFELVMFLLDENSPLNGGASRYRIYGIARDITEKRESQAMIHFRAHHDALTGLPNRALFVDRVKTAIVQAARHAQVFAVLFIDLDRFKLVNDSIGHSFGDSLLKDVSMRLSACVRQCDTLCRYGGDEFTLLLPDAKSPRDAVTVAKKIVAVVNEPFTLDGYDISLGASVGIAFYPHHGKTADELIKNADCAMYQIKKAGKNNYQIFDDDMMIDVKRRLMLEQDLKHALGSDQFEIHYQKQIDSVSRRVTGIEALIRWNHPKHGFLGPDQFISVAEESRQIVDLDKQTLRQACREVRGFYRNGLLMPRLSVNFSPLSFEMDGFVDDILAILEEEGFDPAMLDMEITENILVANREDIVDKLRKLADLGVQIAIDDFGTGYSSLSYIHKLPIKILKIDRSFVNMIDRGNAKVSIVDAIIAMAKGLNIRVIAEGVENDRQLDYLCSLGCDCLQGFYIARPAPIGQLPAAGDKL